MDVLFEADFLLSEKFIREQITYRTFRSPSAIFLYVWTPIAVAVLLFNWIVVRKIYWILIALVAVCWLSELFTYFRSIKQSVELHKDVNRGEMYSLHRTVTEERITFQNSLGKQSEHTYDQFKYAKVLKNSILLVAKTKEQYLFAKDGFTKGTAEEFLAFLKSKNVKIK